MFSVALLFVNLVVGSIVILRLSFRHNVPLSDPASKILGDTDDMLYNLGCMLGFVVGVTALAAFIGGMFGFLRGLRRRRLHREYEDLIAQQ